MTVAVVRVTDLLPTTAAMRHGPDALWARFVDIRTPGGINHLYNVIVYEETEAQRHGIAALVATARALRGDILNLAAGTWELAEPDVRALMLATTLGPAMVGVQSRQFSLTYDWVLWSITDTWDTDGTFDLNFGWVVALPQRHSYPTLSRTSSGLG
jgi:hypothetical protein